MSPASCWGSGMLLCPGRVLETGLSTHGQLIIASWVSQSSGWKAESFRKRMQTWHLVGADTSFPSVRWKGRSLNAHDLLLKTDSESWCSVELGRRQGPKIYTKTLKFYLRHFNFWCGCLFWGCFVKKKKKSSVYCKWIKTRAKIEFGFSPDEYFTTNFSFILTVWTMSVSLSVSGVKTEWIEWIMKERK